jgi:hypothetical protein
MVYIKSLIISNDKPPDALKEGKNEENLPAEHSPEKENPRIFRAEEFEERKKRSETEAGERKKEIGGLTVRIWPKLRCERLD